MNYCRKDSRIKIAKGRKGKVGQNSLKGGEESRTKVTERGRRKQDKSCQKEKGYQKKVTKGGKGKQDKNHCKGERKSGQKKLKGGKESRTKVT